VHVLEGGIGIGPKQGGLLVAIQAHDSGRQTGRRGGLSDGARAEDQRRGKAGDKLVEQGIEHPRRVPHEARLASTIDSAHFRVSI